VTKTRENLFLRHDSFCPNAHHHYFFLSSDLPRWAASDSNEKDGCDFFFY